MHLPLNSLHITAGQLWQLSTALGLMSSGSTDDIRLVIKGKISDLSCEPCNVQVLFEEHTSDAAFKLWDESGEFLIISSTTIEHPPSVEEPCEGTDREPHAVEPDELESLWQLVAAITTERDTLQSELETVRQELELKMAKIKELWRMSCGQVAEYDSMIVAKDEKIVRLKAQLTERRHQRTPSSLDDDAASQRGVDMAEHQQ